MIIITVDNMPDIPKFMNVLNLETRNAVDTRRMEHANAYAERSNGLIKSASTSTCCANENALFKKSHNRRYLLHREQQNASLDRNTPAIDVAEHDRLNFALVSSLAWSALARNATLCSIAADENAAKNTLNLEFYLNGLKHFSDCNLNNVGLLPHQQQQQQQQQHHNNDRKYLDVLIGWRGSDGSYGSLTNVHELNDVMEDSRAISGTLPIEKVDEERETSEKIEDEENSKVNDGEEKIAESLNVENGLSEKEDQVGDECRQSTGELKDQDEHETSEENESSIVNEERRRKGSVFQAPSLDKVQNEVEDASSAPSTPTPEKESRSPAEEKRCRRSSSLKMPKKDDANPAEKKIVRFADALGLDLADVRTFLDELPSVPLSAYSDLHHEDELSARSSFSPVSASVEKTLVPMFKQPQTSFSFLERVRDNNVSLEYAKVCPTPVCSITGTVRVRNLDFFKSVYVRYTMDGWRTFNELQAVYVPDSCDGFSDQFAFVIYVYDVKVNQRVEMAIRFHCSGSQFWDNNNGSNYVFQCLPSAPIAPSHTPSYFHSYNPMNDMCQSFY